MIRRLKLFLMLLACAIIIDSVASNLARVVKVLDGDTYVLRKGNKDFTVRLNNVDAPESKQHFGFQSGLYTSQMILGKVVRYDSTGTDMYKRVLADVWMDNKRLDSLLIRNGWAWQYVQYSNDSVLKNCMQLAMDEKIGLWKCGTMAVCPPSLWRSYSKRDRIRFCDRCK